MTSDYVFFVALVVWNEIEVAVDLLEFNDIFTNLAGARPAGRHKQAVHALHCIALHTLKQHKASFAIVIHILRRISQGPTKGLFVFPFSLCDYA